MALDRNTLESTLAATLRTNFQKGVNEEWSGDDAANAMAKAIADVVHAYVSAARVTGVASQVRDNGNAVIGTATQTGDVGLS
ncbi:hypothetical protein LVB77_16435 [Lysobacter sp. 5GHs7-4]|uniref:hypothetical protein n=1 Tax=Lysobacter sp. 5GHs7-4 TaxID=2904253 RepID=UPI001E59EB1C|nr:hypothetical protein [Lysobacter sp. 5GHs7-4]UHQ22240.1 hypothetical protein LVB77_16435 [Lysobacter sp. 5GHs7-4]